MANGILYLLPSVLAEHATNAIPAYVRETVALCHSFFVEEERTARRFLKSIWREMVIDDYQWHKINPKDHTQKQILLETLSKGLHVGVLSEAGCPGVADPGQMLVSWAQEAGFTVKPLVGPNSILLALMASGMNGQQFCFHGYLPTQPGERILAIKNLEQESRKKGATQIFIETPYRNNHLLDSILQACQAQTRLCVAVNITGEGEMIRTRKISEWQKDKPVLGKLPAIFLLQAGT